MVVNNLINNSISYKIMVGRGLSVRGDQHLSLLDCSQRPAIIFTR